VVIQVLDQHEAADSRFTHQLMQQANGWQVLPRASI